MKNTFETKTQSSLFQMLALAIASWVVFFPAPTSTSTTVGFTGNSQGTQIIIDDFTDAQGPDVVLPPAGSQTGSVTDGNMLGGERDIILNLEISQSSGGGASIEALNGMLNFHQDVGQGAQALIIYDGPDGSADTVRTTGLNGVDLTNAGTHNAFEIKVLSCSAPFDLTIVGFNGPTNSSELTKVVPQTQTEITLSFPFDEFSNSGGSSADLSNLAAFPFSKFNISGGSGVDFSNLGALLLLVNFQNTVTGELDVELGQFRTAGPPPALEVLFDTAQTGVLSDLVVSYYGPDNPRNAEVAQPFEVPPGESWRLEFFGWLGLFSPNTSPDPTANVTIYNNEAGQVGEVVVELPGRPLFMNGALLSTDLPAVFLPSGNYYAGFSAITPIGSEMKVFENSETGFPSPYLYQNPGGDLTPGCTVWTPGNQCGGSDPILALLLGGTRVVDGPAVMDDSYDCIGNTGISVPASAGVLTNDGPGQVVDFDATGAQNGAVNVAPDGGFTYNPPPGFEGMDTFSYTSMNNEGGTSTATVEIDVADMIWFIDADNGSLNLGTFSDPFGDFGLWNDALLPGPDDGLVILPGDYSGNLELDDGQVVIGGYDPDIAAALLQEAGWSVSEHSNIHTVALDFPPFLTNSDGPAVIVAKDNAIYDVNIGDAPGFFAITDNGSNVGSLKIHDVSVTTSGGALGILNGGDLDVDLVDVVSSGSIVSEDPYVIHLRDVTGTIKMSTLKVGTAENPSPNCAIFLEDSPVDVRVETLEANIEVPESTTDAAAIRASGGGSIIMSNGFINTKGAGIMDLVNTDIDATCDHLSSTDSPKPAISITNSNATMTVTGKITIRNSKITAISIGESDLAINIEELLDIDFPFDGPDLRLGIELVSVTGTFSSGSTKITNASDAGIQITKSGEDFSASFGSTSISVNGNGIDLRDNSSASFTFGDLSVVSEGGFGLRASNSGTLNIGSEENSILATGGAALDITNTDLGEGWTFTRLSSIDSPGAGVSLGGDAGDIQISNVTIENPSGKGISIENCIGNYSFDNIDISAADTAVDLFNNDGLVSLTNGSITGSVIMSTGTVAGNAVTVLQVDIQAPTPINMAYLPANLKAPLAKTTVATEDSMTAIIQVMIGNRASVELVFEDNTVVSPGEGISITTLDTSEALVTLSGNDISSDSSNFSLIQTGASFLRLDGFAGGDSAAVATFIQENNVGTPTVSVSGIISGDGTTSVTNTEAEVIPSHFELAQNFPNPFNPETTIRYLLPEVSQVKLMIYNLRGQRIVTLVDQEQQSGIYSVQWDGKNEAGRDVASGLYLYLLKAQKFTSVQKLALIR